MFLNLLGSPSQLCVMRLRDSGGQVGVSPKESKTGEGVVWKMGHGWLSIAAIVLGYSGLGTGVLKARTWEREREAGQSTNRKVDKKLGEGHLW